MRWFVLGLATLSLSGCGLVAIPPALTIASYAADGISYLVSGKSLTDHAISEVAEADCAMWRMIKMQNPCLNEEGEAEMLIAFEGDPYDPPPRLNEPDSDWDPADPGAPAGEPEQVVPAPAGEAVAEASVPEDAAEEGEAPNVRPAAGPMSPAGPRLGGAPTVLVQDLPMPTPTPMAEPVPGVVAAAPAPQPTAEPASQLQGDGDLVAVAGGSVDDPDPVQLAALPADAAPAPAVGERRFLVIGSFADLSNAERLVRRHPRLDPLIAPAEISGERFWRVVTETAAAEDAELMREWLARNGFASAWPIAACAAGTSAPGCLVFGGDY